MDTAEACEVHMTLSFDDFKRHQIKLLLFAIQLTNLPALRPYFKT